MTTPIPDDVWFLITDRLNVADVEALTSVDRRLHNKVRTNPRAWQEHLSSCTDGQLTHVASVVPALEETVRRLLKLRAMTTLAGTAKGDFTGDGGPAHHATLAYPRGVAVGPDATVYIADTFNHRIRHIGTDGTITTLAGTGESGFSGDGGPAHHAELAYPRDVAVGPDATVYIADSFNRRVRFVTTDGIMSTLAGTGQLGFSGDGGPAHLAPLSDPRGVAVGPDATVYIADTANNHVRLVTKDGVITTLTGTGQGGFGGDDGPARQATLRSPHGVAVGPDGAVYIADMSNHRIRRIGTDGIITTVAGTGHQVFGGDGRAADQATLHSPHGVAVGPDGAVYIADTFNHRIRHIGTDGIITTVAGTGQHGYGGDDGPAHHATLAYPHAIAMGPGSLIHVTTDHYLRRFGTRHS
ncbi:hypothetical protein ACFYPT_38060 [Streptomyces sp. NPDC005529]|uniref:NHL domain-containing protein n=1 Tax=unclassified Streptomyces TaxID=2593676 RepID=UPI0033A4B545